MRQVRLALIALFIAMIAARAMADTATSLGARIGEAGDLFSSLAQVPEANLFSGALTTGVQIKVPPGRSVTPKLALSYTSTGGSSPFGYGWSLPIGQIERTTKWGSPRCTSSHFNEFVLSMSGVTSELVKDGTSYKPRLEEAYLEAQFDEPANVWTVRDKAGYVYRFGVDSTDKIGSTTSAASVVHPDGTCEFTTIWALSEIRDPNGNSVDIEWSNLLNQLIPSTVRYGANVNAGSSHLYQVSFTYGPRPDVISSYRTGCKQTLWLRLVGVDVSSIVDQLAIRSYELTYDDSRATPKSILSSVLASGEPTQSFSYTPSTTGYSPSVVYLSTATKPFLRRHNPSVETYTSMLDMNGDGFLDQVTRETANWSVLFGGRSSGIPIFSAAVTWTTPTSTGFGNQLRNVFVDPTNCPKHAGNLRQCTALDTFDLNGDGLPDYVVANATSWTVYYGRYSSGWGFSQSPTSDNWSPGSKFIRVEEQIDPSTSATYQDIVDLNGDGLVDFVKAGTTTWEVAYNNGHGFDPAITIPAASTVLAYTHSSGSTLSQLLDFNGDGLPDYVTTYDALPNLPGYECNISTTGSTALAVHKCLEVWFNTGAGFRPDPLTIPLPIEGGSLSQVVQGETLHDLFDVNGDGLPDWVSSTHWNTATSQYEDGWSVLLNTGGGLEPVSYSTAPIGMLGAYNIGSWAYASRLWFGGAGPIRVKKNSRDLLDVVDLDGDGFLDRVVAGSTGNEAVGTTATWQVVLNRAGATTNTGSDPTQRPTLMSLKANGIGGKQFVSYKPSTSYDNSGGDGRPDLAFVVWVIDKTRNSDGLCAATGDVFSPAENSCIAQGHDVVTKFRYQDGRFDPSSREFRGFRRVDRIGEEAHLNPAGSVVDDPDNSIVSTFGQESDTKGRLLQVDTYAGASCVSGAAEVDCTTSPSLIQTSQNQWNTTPLSAGRTRIWLRQNSTYFVLPGGVPQYIATVNEPPDSYGNITESAKKDLFGGIYLQEHTDYAIPSAGDVQVHNRPSHTRSWDSSGTLSEQWFYYDDLTANGAVGKGNVTRTQSRVNSSLANGPETKTTYDPYGNVTTVEDANHHRMVTVYDNRNLYPAVIYNHLNQFTKREMDYRYGLPSKVTDENGRDTSYTYDTAGRVLCVAGPGEQLSDCPIRYTYTLSTGFGILNSVTVTEKQDPYDATGCPATSAPRPDLKVVRSFDGLARSRYTDSFRVVEGISTTVRDGHTDYDGSGRIAKVFGPYLPATESADPLDAEVFDYAFQTALPGLVDPLGRVQRQIHTDGTFRRTDYLGTETVVRDEAGEVTHLLTDPLGRVVLIQKDKGGLAYSSMRSTYDGLGRIITIAQNDINPIRTMSYDNLGRRTTVTDLDSGVWKYRYDAVGNTIAEDPPAAGQTQYCYDELNRVQRRCWWPDDSPVAHACSEACSDPSSDKVSYYYDGDDGWTVPNAIGLLTRVSDPSGQYDVKSYDVRSRPTETLKTVLAGEAAHLASFSYSYDRNDRIKTITYPDDEVVTTEYDDSGQPRVLRNSGSEFYVLNALYDKYGRATTLERGNYVRDVRTYGAPTARHRLASLKTEPYGGVGTPPPGSGPYLHLTYTEYDPRGFVRKVRDVRNSTGDLSDSADYSYDALGRLLSIDSPLAAYDQAFEFDAYDNIKRLDDQYFDYSVAKPHQATKVHIGSPTGPWSALSYNADGNRDGKNGQVYSYNGDGRIRTVAANGFTSEYVYDYMGRRVVKRDASPFPSIVRRYYDAMAETGGGVLTKWYFFGGQRLASRRVADVSWEVASLPSSIWLASAPGGLPLFRVVASRRVLTIGSCVATAGVLVLFVWSASGTSRRRLGRSRATLMAVLWCIGTFPWPVIFGASEASAQTVGLGLFHFHLTALGSTEAITDTAGHLVEQIRYSPYGELRGRWDGANTSSGSSTASYEFAGYESQPESGLQYASARFYDPSLGTFLSRDIAGQFANPYSYVGWNPVSASDPTGKWAELIPWALAGLSIVSSAIQSAINGDSAGRAIGHALGGAATGLAFQLAVIGPVAKALGDAAIAVYAAQVAYGSYAIAKGFESGQYVAAGFGAVQAAYGLYSLAELSLDTFQKHARAPVGLTAGTTGAYAGTTGATAGTTNATISPNIPNVNVKVQVTPTGKTVTIDATVQFKGATTAALESTTVQAIERAWSGQFPQYQVATHITVVQSGADFTVDFDFNAYSLSPASGAYTNYVGGNQVHIHPVVATDGYFASHEFGHVMGMVDHYNTVTGLADPGFQNRIMGAYGGVVVQDDFKVELGL